MTHKEMQSTSKFISLILRHRPDTIGISLDEHGWASVDELLKGLESSGHKISISDLEEIVNTDEKQRYSFSEDKALIRANQGHSIPVDVELQEVEPPDILYHGTSSKYIESIKTEGLKPMNRLYVHLSEDTDTANKVANRRRDPQVLTIDTAKMRADGVKFYKSVNNVWLTKYVDPKYITFI